MVTKFCTGEVGWASPACSICLSMLSWRSAFSCDVTSFFSSRFGRKRHLAMSTTNSNSGLPVRFSFARGMCDVESLALIESTTGFICAPSCADTPSGDQDTTLSACRFRAGVGRSLSSNQICLVARASSLRSVARLMVSKQLSSSSWLAPHAYRQKLEKIHREIIRLCRSGAVQEDAETNVDHHGS